MFLKENNDLIIGEQNQPSYKKEKEGVMALVKFLPNQSQPKRCLKDS